MEQQEAEEVTALLGEESLTNSKRSFFTRKPRRERGCVCVCAACQKSSKLKTGLLKQKQIHTRRNQVWSYVRTDCRKSFGRRADLI